MIHEVEGDILTTTAVAIAHGVAANDPMNQGLAAALHQRYPAKLGRAGVWSGVGGVRVINLITQDGGYEHGSKPQRATASSVNHALRALRKLIVDEHIASVALPRLGGLDWSEIKPLIDNQLGDVAAEIYVYRESASATKAAGSKH